METFYVALITGLIAITCILVISVMVSMYADTKRRAGREEESAKNRARAESSNIITGAVKRANDMMVKAELSGIEAVARKKLEAEKYEEEYERELQNVLSHTIHDFTKANEVLEREYKEFLKNVQDTIKTRLQNNTIELEKHLSVMKIDTQKNLETFMNAQRMRIESQIDNEIKATARLLEEYRLHRQKLVDEHIVDIVEDTAKELLSTQLSIKDHTAAVLESLEEAKKEGFFKQQTYDTAA